MADVPAHRLTPVQHIGIEWMGIGALAGWGVFIWCVIVWALLANGESSNPQGLLAVIVSGVLVWLLTGVVAYRWGQLVAAGLAGMVVVTVDGQPFVPGGSYRGRVTQAGLFRLTVTGVRLAHEESAVLKTEVESYSFGKTVAMFPVGLLGPLDFVVAVPAGAMHSFKGAHNEIAWTLRVSGRVARFLPYRASFHVSVQSGAGDA